MSDPQTKPGDADERALARPPTVDVIARTRRRQRRRVGVTIVIGFAMLVVAGGLEGLIVWESDRKLTALRNAWRPHEAASEDLASQVRGGSAAVNRIARATDTKVAEMAATIEWQRRGEHDAAVAIVRDGAGREYIDRIRDAIGDLETMSDVSLRPHWAGSPTG
jgi:hypothetical protein